MRTRDSVKLGNPRPLVTDDVTALMLARRRQLANEGGAAIDPAVFVGAYITIAYKTGPVAGISAPTGNGPIPTGWAAVPYAPEGTDVLWVSRATCAADNTPIGVWSTPVQYIIVADYIRAGVELTSPLIIGGTIKTAESGSRLEILSEGGTYLKFYLDIEALPGTISTLVTNGAPWIQLMSPKLSSTASAYLKLYGETTGAVNRADLFASNIRLYGDVMVEGHLELHDSAEYVQLYYDHASNTLKLDHGGVIKTITAT